MYDPNAQRSSPGPTFVGRRVVFIDALRLLAAVQMVQGHSIDAVLSDAARSGPVFSAWTFVRGLTSVAFLVAAGLSFSLVAWRPGRHDEAPRGPSARLKRAGRLIAIGYALHVLAVFWSASAEASAWVDATIVDVLQCIGVSLCALELCAALARRRRRFAFACAVTALVLLGIAPLTNELGPHGLAAPLTHYLSSRGGSLFPLTPFAGFVFAGAAIGVWALPRLTESAPVASATRLFFAGACSLLLAACASALGFGGEGPMRLSSTFTKLGLVCLVAASLAFSLRHVSRLPTTLETLAGETLFMYVAHVVVLYASGIGVSTLLGHALGAPAAVVFALGMIVLFAGAALGWARFAGRAPPAPLPA